MQHLTPRLPSLALAARSSRTSSCLKVCWRSGGTPSTSEWQQRKERSQGALARATHAPSERSTPLPPPPTLLCARAALLRARTRCKKLPSDFIEKLPASVTKIARDAFEDTPLHDQCIARSIELFRAKYDLDETGTIITFKEGTETIEGVARADKEKVLEVIIPEGVKVLAKKAFEGCKLLAAVTLPQTLEEIGDEAFKE